MKLKFRATAINSDEVMTDEGIHLLLEESYPDLKPGAKCVVELDAGVCTLVSADVV